MKKSLLKIAIAWSSACLPLLASVEPPPAAVPEPASFLLVGGGLAAAILITRKRMRK
ncbi:MAG: PEP-CTERM sorting domain-containing protein [Bryobacter sp.]|jgi:hypothetical protein|nr:PEP-CTERM sorting domain-containing protein [Bryobacter sp.]